MLTSNTDSSKQPLKPISPRSMRSRNQQPSGNSNILHEKDTLQPVFIRTGRLRPEVVYDERERNPVDHQHNGSETHPVTKEDGKSAHEEEKDRSIEEKILVPGEAVNHHGLFVQPFVSEVIVGFKEKDKAQQDAAKEIENVFH